MTSPRLLLAALAASAAVAGCGSSVGESGIGFAEPSAVAVFHGVTAKRDGVHPYVAVANAARDDLNLFDAVDDKPVAAPVLTEALLVPVPDPRPTQLLASSLWDGIDVDQDPAPDPLPARTPDLLVVASSGAPVLQLVKTWAADVQIVRGQAVDLGALAPGAQIVAMAAMPVLDGGTPARRVPGRVRVLVALTGARLAAVEYVRGEGGAIAVASAEVRTLEAGAPFEPAALAVSPFDPLHLYVATPDPIGGVLGVAELEATGPLAAWPVRALDARGPTRLVAAWRLHERLPDAAGEPPAAFEAEPADRVYAALEPGACGPDERTPCGIAVLDPAAGGPRADYAGLMPYLAPIRVPGLPTALVISGPPAVPASVTDSAAFRPPWMRISPATGARGTSAVMAIPSSDGRVYFADLARWAIPNERSMLRTTSRTRVTQIAAAQPLGTDRRIGLWTPGATPAVVLEGDDLIAAVKVTPGFTTSETWTVTFQGELPGLARSDAHSGETGVDGAGRTTLALQVGLDLGGGERRLTRVVRLYDPALGLHPGDVVTLSAPHVDGCPDDDPETGRDESAVEARVAELLAPSASAPGGAVALEPSLEDPTVDDPDTEVVEAPEDWPACVAALGAGQAGVRAAFRAASLVLVGSATGYAGRPEIAYDATAETPPFALEYQDEDALACPLDPWPEDPAAVACDAACRATCEALSLARKARRIYHLSDVCLGSVEDVDCGTLWGGLSFPRANGPVVAFRLAYVAQRDDDGNVVDPGGLLPADDQLLWGELRELGVGFTTQDAITPSYRAPSVGVGAAATMPRGAVAFDRSGYEGKAGDAYRFYVAYVQDFVFDMSPAQAFNTPLVLR